MFVYWQTSQQIIDTKRITDMFRRPYTDYEACYTFFLSLRVFMSFYNQISCLPTVQHQFGLVLISFFREVHFWKRRYRMHLAMSVIHSHKLSLPYLVQFHTLFFLYRFRVALERLFRRLNLVNNSKYNSLDRNLDLEAGLSIGIVLDFEFVVDW